MLSAHEKLHAQGQLNETFSVIVLFAFEMPMKSTARSLAKAKPTKAAPLAPPALKSGPQHRAMLNFNADIPVYSCSSLGSSSAAAFVIGGGGGRAKTGVKNGLHVLVPPFDKSKTAGEGSSLPFVNLDSLQVLSLCSSNGQLHATTVESIVTFGANVSADCSMNETSRLSLNFAKSAKSIADFSSASTNLKDAISKGATGEERLQLTRVADKALVELDSQNVRLYCTACSIFYPASHSFRLCLLSTARRSM